MCFVWISEQTAIISLYSIDWLICIAETECVYCAVRTGSIYNSTFCPHSIFMCFVCISEQTAIISLYSINWLVFITEMKSVYCAVRTGSMYNSTFCPHSCIYVLCVDLRTNSHYFPIQHWLTGLYNLDAVCLLRGTDWVFKSTSFNTSLKRVQYVTFYGADQVAARAHSWRRLTPETSGVGFSVN